MAAERPEPANEVGGDPACWLHRVCPECGRFNEVEGARFCAECGSPMPATERAD